MSQIVLTACAMLSVVFVIYVFRKRNILQKENSTIISKILVTLNIPCLIVNLFKDVHFTPSLLYAVFMGMIANIFGTLVAYYLSKKQDPHTRAIYILSASGYNLGIFTIPFATTFLSSSALVTVVMFDIGNAIIAFGATYAICAVIVNSEKKSIVKTVVSKLSHSVPFICYLVMIVIEFLNIQLPSVLYVFTDYISASTGFLGMVLIGLIIDFKIDMSEVKTVSLALIMRYSISAIICITILAMPFDAEIKKSMLIAVVSPVLVIAVVHAENLKCKSSTFGMIASLSIIISIVLIILVEVFL